MKPVLRPGRAPTVSPASAAAWEARLSAAAENERAVLAGGPAPRLERDPYTGVVRETPKPAERVLAISDSTIAPDPLVSRFANEVAQHLEPDHRAVCWRDWLSGPFGCYVVHSDAVRVEVEPCLVDEVEYLPHLHAIAKAAANLVVGKNSWLLPGEVTLCQGGKDEDGRDVWRLEPASPVLVRLTRAIKGALPLGLNLPIGLGPLEARFVTVVVDGPTMGPTRFEVQWEALDCSDLVAAMIVDFCLCRTRAPVLDSGLRLRRHDTRDVFVMALESTPIWD
jgi:hypothetical protein